MTPTITTTPTTCSSYNSRSLNLGLSLMLLLILSIYTILRNIRSSGVSSRGPSSTRARTWKRHPYVIEWNLKRVLRGTKAPYLIKRYADTVKAEDFNFGSSLTSSAVTGLDGIAGVIEHNLWTDFVGQLSQTLEEDVCPDGLERQAEAVQPAQAQREELMDDHLLEEAVDLVSFALPVSAPGGKDIVLAVQG
ncbi:Vacuolar import and degradation protein 27 [Cytospora mali]|uniref:Vacuolar import and degradation protein 27 n=1 Tax=Cytospora mali TaxID=578113 RepID=A0A194VJH2_CYTMA|nr:Vacuolar import and degradation protein 27 [Valsa mali]